MDLELRGKGGAGYRRQQGGHGGLGSVAARERGAIAAGLMARRGGGDRVR